MQKFDFGLEQCFGEERDPYAHLSGTGGDVQIADILRTIKHETHEEKKENKVINLL